MGIDARRTRRRRRQRGGVRRPHPRPRITDRRRRVVQAHSRALWTDARECDEGAPEGPFAVKLVVLTSGAWWRDASPAPSSRRLDRSLLRDATLGRLASRRLLRRSLLDGAPLRRSLLRRGLLDGPPLRRLASRRLLRRPRFAGAFLAAFLTAFFAVRRFAGLRAVVFFAAAFLTVRRLRGLRAWSSSSPQPSSPCDSSPASVPSSSSPLPS